ncbi:hypothetical protein Syun_009611 [Stephania yunnanensis]|uniref:X8 domain-containing protein n=1 Tax=Stephania yunnanensis TaxID=152371 RepID=A0AAP0KEY8_9MAGN
MTMSSFLPRFLLVLLFVITISQKSDGQFDQWCIADEQTPNEVLQEALDWACGRGGADCTKIQVNQPCYSPNTVKDHASYAFNSYYQKFKNKGATCYFNAAAMVTDLDPSHNGCKFELFH